MDALLSLIKVVAVASVAGVQFVSEFPQTNSNLNREPARASASIVLTYVAAHSAAHGDGELPPNLTFPSSYRSVFDLMRQRSPTFRRQCARIAGASRLTVELRTDPPPAGSRARALTRIVRDPLGVTHAVMQIGGVENLTELIAHELEHVIEQLDGIDLRSKARFGSSGVRHCGCAESDAFETARAIAMGLRVAREVGEQGN